MVVAWSAHVLVQWQGGLGGLAGDGRIQRPLVQATTQDGGDALVGRRANRLRPRTGCLQPQVAVLTTQPHQAQTGAVALLGMLAMLHLPAHHGRSGRAHALAPGDELGWRPLQVRPVRGRHVLGRGGVRTPAGIEGMGGHAFVAVQDFHRAGRDAQLDLLAHQSVGDRVVVAIELDVVVDVDAGGFEACDGHAHRRQGAKGWPIELGKGAGAVARQLLEWSLVQVHQQGGDGPVELGQTEEGLVAQAGQNPALDHLHGDLHLGFVAWLGRARGHHGQAVVRREFFQQAVRGGLVAVGAGHEGTRLVGHQQAGDAADELQRGDDAGRPVGSLLAGCGAGVGVVRCPQHRHKYLCLAYLAAAGIHDGHRLAGVVHKQLVAGLVGLAHGALKAPDPGLVLLAEGAVFVGLARVLLLVLFPQQLQRDTGAAQFAVDVGAVGLQVAGLSRHRWLVQPGLQLLVAQALGQAPVHARHACVAGYLADGGLGDAESGTDLAGAQGPGVQQLQCVS